MCKIGFDGNSGRTQYHVRTTTNTTGNYSSLMHTAFVPITLTDSENNIVWKNDNPSSVKFCRPVRISWEKEDNDTMKREFDRLVTEFDNLNPTIVEKDGKIYIIKYKLIFTMFDGKAVNCLTNTKSSMVCANCKASPKDFNRLDYILTLKVDIDTLYFGISPLHMYIRALEYILHIAYRLGIKKWRVPAAEQYILKVRKRAIQEKLKKKGSQLIK